MIFSLWIYSIAENFIDDIFVVTSNAHRISIFRQSGTVMLDIKATTVNEVIEKFVDFLQLRGFGFFIGLINQADIINKINGKMFDIEIT